MGTKRRCNRHKEYGVIGGAFSVAVKITKLKLGLNFAVGPCCAILLLYEEVDAHTHSNL